MMIWILPSVVLSGALAGFAAPFAIKAFDVLPLFPGLRSDGLPSVFEEIHKFTFDALIIVLVVHVGFHVWRQYMVKDNALRIMLPKVLHRYL